MLYLSSSTSSRPVPTGGGCGEGVSSHSSVDCPWVGVGGDNRVSGEQGLSLSKCTIILFLQVALLCIR